MVLLIKLSVIVCYGLLNKEPFELKNCNWNSIEAGLDRRRRAWVATMFVSFFCGWAGSAAADSTSTYRVLHVMSYHESWEWNQDQFKGFKDALTGLDVDYRVEAMDTKNNPDEAWKKAKGQSIQVLIDEWQPDLVYTNDDDAQNYVARHYVGSAIPFVFSGVNAAPATYGFTGSPNITGVLEQEHSLQTIRLLQQIVPDVRRIAVIVDQGPTWPGVIERLQQALAADHEVEIVAVDTIKTFAEYQRKILDYQGKVDALGILGVFGFKDEAGNNVPYQNVLQWTAENSTLPDFSFWGDRPELGTLCAMRVSGLAQGNGAGKMARAILLGEQQASDFSMEPTLKGEPVISLARARKLGIQVPTSLLLNARVVTSFRWDL